MTITLHHGDSEEILRTMPENSVDAVVCDPPYDLVSIQKRFGKEGSAPAQYGKDGAFSRLSKGFMGQSWDGTGIAFRADFWAEVLRVLKPGGYLLATGGTRTYHRMTCAIEDAGFEIRDSIFNAFGEVPAPAAWLYGSGFPKSRSMREIGRPELGTALKPAWEPIVCARKPLAAATVAGNVLQFGTGALNIDAARVSHNEPIRTLKAQETGHDFYKQAGRYKDVQELKPEGRWPPNVAMTHTALCQQVGVKRVTAPGLMKRNSAKDGFGDTGTVFKGALNSRRGNGYADADGLETVPEFVCHESCPIRIVGEQSGERKSGGKTPFRDAGMFGLENDARTHYKETGTSARFFPNFQVEPDAPFLYCAKASRAERSKGLPDHIKASHPTVKPLALMKWLITLICPPGGTILDPFAGSGSTLVAAAALGFDAIGIEREAEYIAICQARVDHALNQAAAALPSLPLLALLEAEPEPEAGAWECADGCPIKTLDEQAGPSVARPVRPENLKQSGDGENKGLFGLGSKVQTGYYDESSKVSRFFPNFEAEP